MRFGINEAKVAKLVGTFSHVFVCLKNSISLNTDKNTKTPFLKTCISKENNKISFK